MRGIDCFSTIRPEWAPQLKALGYGFAARYYRRAPLTGGRGNAVSKEEVAGVHASGLAFLPVFQNTSNFPEYFTETAARADAAAARAKAIDIGQPHNTAIYFAVDCDPSENTDLLAVHDYFTTIVHALPEWRIGVYGSGLVCKALDSYSIVDLTWLANARGWRGYNDWLPHADVVQTTLPFTLPFGLQVDGNEARNDAGMWLPETKKPLPETYEPAESGWWGAVRTAVRLLMGQRT